MSGYELDARDKQCPACEGVVAIDAVVCTRCGLNFKTGTRMREAARDPGDEDRERKLLERARRTGDNEAVLAAGLRPPVAKGPGTVCIKCGYSLVGLNGRPCPECGTGSGPLGDRDVRRERQIGNYWRTTWLVAGLGLGSGLAVCVALGAIAGYNVGGDAQSAIAGGMGGVLRVAMCIAALLAGYFGLCLLFLGFEEDVRGLTLRLLGVGAVWAVLLAVLGFVPLAGIGIVVIGAVISVVALAIPLHVLTDRDWDDCWWIAAGSWAMMLIVSTILALFF